jgi:hypothetical protein
MPGQLKLRAETIWAEGGVAFVASICLVILYACVFGATV